MSIVGVRLIKNMLENEDDLQDDEAEGDDGQVVSWLLAEPLMHSRMGQQNGDDNSNGGKDNNDKCTDKCKNTNEYKYSIQRHKFYPFFYIQMLCW